MTGADFRQRLQVAILLVEHLEVGTEGTRTQLVDVV
jgi:hypothetical protein